MGSFPATVEFFPKTAGARLGLAFDGENVVQNGDVGLERDAHKGIGNGAQNFARMEGAALPDNAQGDDRPEFFGAGETLDLEWDLVGPWDADNRDVVPLERRLRGGEERVGVFAIVFADDETEPGF